MAVLFLYSCGTASTVLLPSEMDRSDVNAEQIVSRIPDYRQTLTTISGSGRAIVSEPDNSERVSLQFQANRNESLITVRNSLGIEGGQIYADKDSLLIYNRVDKYAERIPLHEGRLTSIGSLASVNVLDLLNYTVDSETVTSVYQNDDYYLLITESGSQVTIRRDSFTISEVVHHGNASHSYSRVEYDGYSNIDGYLLPGRVTIYSRDGTSRAALLVQRMETNAGLPPLRISIPDDIPVLR